MAKGTADDYLWPLVQRKLDVLSQAGLSKDNFHDASCSSVKEYWPYIYFRIYFSISLFQVAVSKHGTMMDYFEELSLENFEESILEEEKQERFDEPKRKKRKESC